MTLMVGAKVVSSFFSFSHVRIKDLVISFENQLAISEVKLILFMWFDIPLIHTHLGA